MDAISQIPRFNLGGAFNTIPLRTDQGETLAEVVVKVNDVEVMNPLAGDYNFDGKVSAADYTVWRDLLGSTVSLWADGDDSGTVDPGDLEVWKMNYDKQIVDGDYNFDGKVTAADFTVWRDHFGSTTQAEADGNGDGIVNAADFTIWRDNYGALTAFGEEGGSGAAVSSSPGDFSVPEPSSLAALLILALGWAAGRCGKRIAAR